MAYNHGYGDLENELIDLFGKISPAFSKAEELLKAGADINALGESRDENVLSEIIREYTAFISYEECKGYTQNELDLIIATTLCKIIRFFLSHGFDVNKYDGCFGAQCLCALVLPTDNGYMLEASKILFDAGAKSRTVSDDVREDETPWDFVASEGSYQDICECNHSLGNIYEALYQIYDAVDKGIPYNGIDSYECAIGKKITRVLASRNDKASVFYPMDLPNFKKENCFTSDLFFIYDGGVLRTTEFADFWVDTLLPEGDVVDVTESFSDIVGSSIKNFTFSTNTVRKETTSYTQPITKIEMDNNRCIRFSINFGDVETEDRAAYFEVF